MRGWYIKIIISYIAFYLYVSLCPTWLELLCKCLSYPFILEPKESNILIALFTRINTLFFFYIESSCTWWNIMTGYLFWGRERYIYLFLLFCDILQHSLKGPSNLNLEMHTPINISLHHKNSSTQIPPP